MNKDKVVITGFMGSGKSAVGQALADMLSYRFVDTDQLIEERTGQTVAEIFQLEGEGAFRKWEAVVAQELASERGVVIATGGRLMLDSVNAGLLQETGRVFCLTAEPAQIAGRLSGERNDRPLLDVPDPESRIRELLAERAEGYGQFPQIATDNKSVVEVAREIQSLLIRREITVTHPSGSYDVVVAPHLLTSVRDIGRISGPLAVITDSNVGPLYAQQCRADTVLTMPAGEEHKNLAAANTLYSELLAAGFDRQGTIVALGGGVVGDVAGFVAATYMRGVAFVQCPTSLLAMVDASVGGKTGVDLPEGKNLVGAFKQPQAVLADLATLSTLPAKEFSAGMAEVIKSGIIADPHLFRLVEGKSGAISARSDLELLLTLVADTIEVKRKIVEEDPFEKGRRAVLNLGHTFGHAVEQASGYEIRHGDGVAMGLVASAHMSAELGYCSADLEQRIAELLLRYDLPVSIPSNLSANQIYSAMASDKKKANGQLRFILPREIGDVFISRSVDREQVLATLRQCGAA